MSVPCPIDHGSRERGWAVRGNPPAESSESSESSTTQRMASAECPRRRRMTGQGPPCRILYHALLGRLSRSVLVLGGAKTAFEVLNSQDGRGRKKKRAENAARPWAAPVQRCVGQILAVSGVDQGWQQWQGLARDEHPAQFGALGHARNFGGPQLVPAGRGGDLIGTATPHLLKKVAPTRPREAPSGPLRPVIPRLGRASEPLATGLALP